jgi:hypothetical protein
MTTAWPRRMAMTLVVALCLAGCSAAGLPDASGTMVHMTYDLNDNPCVPDVWLIGVIVPDSDGHAAIQDEEGKITLLVWGSHNTATVTWGHRYRIGGTWFGGTPTFWACAGASAVQPL